MPGLSVLARGLALSSLAVAWLPLADASAQTTDDVCLVVVAPDASNGAWHDAAMSAQAPHCGWLSC